MPCPYCNEVLPEQFKFCPACRRQVKCRNSECESPLLANTPICVECGTEVASTHANGSAQSRFLREVKQSRSNYEERTEIVATDEAISVLAPFVVGQLGGSRIQTPLRFPAVRHRVDPSAQLALAVGDSQEDAQPVEIEAKPADAAPSGSQWSSVFKRASNGELVLLTRDLKGQTRKEQQDRFIMLFVGAHEEMCGGVGPSRDSIVTGSKRAGIYDKNITVYIRRLGNLLVCSDGAYTLNTSGRTEAMEILKELPDANKTGYPYWNGSARPPRTINRTSKEDQAVLQEWLQKPVALGSIDVKALGSTQQAMVALWLITEHLKVTEAVKPMLAYLYLTQKFTTIGGKPKGFTDSFSRPENQHRFRKNADGKYFLLADGIAEVEAMRDGRPAPGKEGGSKK